MAAAFVSMAATAENKHRDLSVTKVDHWVARRVALLAEKPGFALVQERDNRPQRPVLRKQLATAEIKGINAGILDLVEDTHMEHMKACAHIEDGEGSID
jgi:hypothetical protein